MKKILIYLFLFYTYSFSDNLCTENVIRYSLHIDSSWFDKKDTQCSNYGNKPVMQMNGYWYCYYPAINEFWVPDNQTCPSQKNSSVVDTRGIATLTTDGEIVYSPNPDPLGGGQCRDLFQKDGVAYTCNPNTNEATPIENSDGVINDPEMGDVPNCSDGYSPVATQNIPNVGTDEGMYNSWSCESNSGTGDGGSNGGDTGTPTPTITTNPDGSKSWTLPDGTSLHLTTNGTLTTTYPDGSSTVSQVGTSYDPTTGSTGGSGTSTGGGGGTNGNTTNEDNTSSNNDTPVDDTPAANSCTDGSLTLQEKMLCEMNAGMKKLNSESNTQNSLNNLLKDLNNTSNTNATAINTNLKSGNTTLTGIKSLNENQLNEQKKTNDKLKSVENGVDGTNLLLGAANTKLEQIRDNLQDEEGKSYLSKIGDFIDTLTTPTSDEDKNSYGTQINDKVSNTLSSAFSKYSNVLGFGSTYANRPENIKITLFKKEYTLLDFSLFDAYVSIIRSLFLTLAYMYGFMNLLKGSK
jgi:hypothetical protein